MFLRRVVETYGWKCCVWLTSIFLLIKGLQLSLVSTIQLPYSKELHLDGVQYQTNSNIAQIPWAMKGLVGFVSDKYPLWGYSKKYYLLMAAAVGAPALLALALLPNGFMIANCWAIPVLFFLVNIQMSSMDLLCEGKYSELIRNNPNRGSDTVTFVWMLSTIGALIGTSIIGPIADTARIGEDDDDVTTPEEEYWQRGAMTVVFWLCVPLVVQFVVPVLLGWMPEKKISDTHTHTPIDSIINLEESDETRQLQTNEDAYTHTHTDQAGDSLGVSTADTIHTRTTHTDTHATHTRTFTHRSTNIQINETEIENRLPNENTQIHTRTHTQVRTSVEPIDASTIRRNEETRKGIFTVAIVVSISALGLAGVAVMQHYMHAHTQALVLVYALSAGLLCCIVNFKMLPRMMAKCNFYMFMSSATYVLLPGALDYWYTAGDSCVPSGPHFNNTFYLTWTNFVGTFSQLLGVWLFQSVTSSWTFRSAFWVTTVVQSFAAMVDLIVIKRWNLEYLGVSDKATYWIGSACILQLVSMLNFMPSCLLNAKLCPKNAEAASYAILAGFANFGTSVSQALGGFFIRNAGIRTTEPCNFDNLGNLVVLCHFMLPMTMIPLSFLCIPNVYMDATIDIDEPTDEVSDPTDTM
eukprot:GHVR01078008.1.p1 GENE.GHVR01078008.1~~GHVR01078008.1.p1  ORF type:complete len:637 (-),score=146.03 GHVR01078008.1:177-2087(-)